MNAVELSREERLKKMHEGIKAVIENKHWHEVSKQKAIELCSALAQTGFEEGEQFALSQLEPMCKKTIEQVILARGEIQDVIAKKLGVKSMIISISCTIICIMVLILIAAKGFSHSLEGMQ